MRFPEVYPLVAFFTSTISSFAEHFTFKALFIRTRYHEQRMYGLLSSHGSSAAVNDSHMIFSVITDFQDVKHI